MIDIVDTAQLKPKRPGGVQPKHHAPKGKTASAIRRKKIVKAILKGATRQEAGIAAGLSEKTASSQVGQILSEPSTKNTLLEAMKKLGLDDEAIALEHQALIKGKRYLPRRGEAVPDLPAPDAAPAGGAAPVHPGDVPGYIAVDDLQAKAKGIEMYHKLTGRYVDKHEVDVKQPITVVIRKFCSRGEKPKENEGENS
jgi:DNA-binding CsgD family transcriptional regulator